MECVILYRNTQNDKVGFVTDGEDSLGLPLIAVFKHIDDAIEAASYTTVCKAFPYQIVELDEL